jgi:Fur family ferric uptake transcriptional regulator
MPESNNSSAETLRGSGLRATPTRTAVIDVLRATNSHMTASEIIRNLNATKKTFDQSTVYRVLSDLSRVGLIAESRMSPGDTVFEWISQSNHHHLLCTNCSRTMPLDNQLVQEFISKVHNRHGFHVNATHLIVSGTEHACPDNKNR